VRSGCSPRPRLRLRRPVLGRDDLSIQADSAFDKQPLRV
jgi:hypothetical protein